MRVWDYHLIGGSGDHAARRRVRPEVLDDAGWPAWIARQARRYVREDFPAWVSPHLHLPFGTSDDEPVMSFDQYAEAQTAGLDWLTDDYAECLGQVARLWGRPCRAYLGSLPRDPSMRGLPPDVLLDRLAGSLRPLLRAGQTVGLDQAAIAEAGPGSETAAVVDLLDALGVPLYIEPLAHRSRPELLGRDVFVNERFVRSADAGEWHTIEDHLAAGGHVAVLLFPDQSAGETWENFHAWMPDRIRRYMDVGADVAIHQFRLDRRTVDEIAAIVEAKS